MNWLDGLILALLTTAAVLGAYSGLVMQIFRMVGFAGSLYGAVRFHAQAATWLESHLMHDADPRAVTGAAFAGVFLGVYLAIFAATMLLERGVRATQLQYLNRGLGALLSLAKMAAIIGGICWGLEQLPYDQARQMVEASTLASGLLRGVEQVAALVPAQWKDDAVSSWSEVRESLPQAAGNLKGMIPPAGFGRKDRL